MDELNYNKNPLRLPSEKTKGIAGTFLVHGAVFLLLLFVGFGLPFTGDDKGLLVNFGTDETGSGDIEPSPIDPFEEIAMPRQIVPLTRKSESLITQTYDNESPLIKKVDPEAEKKKKEKIEAEKIRKAELDAERVRKAQEDAEKKRLAQEQKRTSDIISRTKNAFTNGRNSGTTSTGEGITGGPGNQGDPNGSVDSKVRGHGGGTGPGGNGISYDLGGRDFQALPEPKYEYQGEGRVVVEIDVDRYGNVVRANPGVKGSTTLDEYLLATAREAALKSKFTAKKDAPSIQKGTIVYNFKLK
ncbi:MAG TPA: energy transducer TonB [Bacteroidales bacterium]|nr:energy transducer TonB [Bacteroidales bacterium]